MRVALKRTALDEAPIEPDGAAEMRLARLQGPDLRRDPAAASDAMRATGFFPGPRVVLVDDAADAAAPALRAALEDWRSGDATLVVAAGNLGPGSALRKAFEAAKAAAAIGVYADPPGRDEVEAAITATGLAAPDRDVFAEIEALAQGLDPGDFARFLEKLALYKRGDAVPLTSDDIAACAPPPPEAEVDAVVALAADGAAAPLATRLPHPRRPRRQPDRPHHRRRPLLPHPSRRRRRRRRPRGGAFPRAPAGLRPPPRPHGRPGPRPRRERTREGPRPHRRCRARPPLVPPAPRSGPRRAPVRPPRHAPAPPGMTRRRRLPCRDRHCRDRR